jgi:hypothetical protein
MSQNTRLGQWLVVMSMLGTDVPTMPGDRRFGLLTVPPSRPSKDPLSRPCTRCGAKVGVPCDRYTLGRKPYHLARMATTDTETT